MRSARRLLSRQALFAGLLLGAALQASAQHSEHPCPAQIDATEASAQPPSGWTAAQDAQRPKRLEGFGLFEGPPEQLAALAPISQEIKPSVRGQRLRRDVWRLDANASTELWIACYYANSSLVLSQPLPRGLSRCQAEDRLDRSGRTLETGLLRCHRDPERASPRAERP